MLPENLENKTVVLTVDEKSFIFTRELYPSAATANALGLLR
jgi:hypothetical protein